MFLFFSKLLQSGKAAVHVSSPQRLPLRLLACYSVTESLSVAIVAPLFHSQKCENPLCFLTFNHYLSESIDPSHPFFK